ncbi:low specificity L-threonine aldolase [Pseudorhodobacter sp. E13]|uniref:threonine aldolase family protein n=1 Tax=Pseudorhodobacter sp. E13 TaxID=2487931 RepID=UPI000F8CA5AE|nr:beta-eliminating lyase-related protein [Pseudorhodobacter sp. E13]RUS59843.1 low specificity L-threonine aldolase [Pseudorhodobacter sp. E13]
MFFASDNGAPVPQPIMEALLRANAGAVLSYGADAPMARLRAQIREIFEAPQAEVHLVTTGTAANALSLALYTPPYGAVLCHRHAHIAEDECGAPEFFAGGAKLHLIDGAHGKITPAGLEAALGTLGGSVHSVQPACLSLTNVTEAGTVYTVDEITALAAMAKAKGLPTHLDGARFANALATSNASPADMTWRAGVDVLSLGGTKNGLLAAEAVVLFDAAKSWELELRRKRAGHLTSKMRYVAAQMEAWFDGGRWLTMAAHANAMAAKLADGLAAIDGAELLHPVQANIAFATLPEAAHARAKAAGAVYYNMGGGLCRLVTAWNTTEADVDALLAAFRG